MASVTMKPRIDQENPQQPLNLKNAAQGRSFGLAKTFQANTSSAPVATPRRALGDLGNTLMTPGHVMKKGTALRPNLLIPSKTPGARKLPQSTPIGRQLLKHIGSLSVETSKKQAFQISQQVESCRKNTSVEKDCFKKEKMYPFTDTEEDVPRSSSINTILQNVDRLYRGCLHPMSLSTTFELDPKPFDLPLQTVTWPVEDLEHMFPLFDTDFEDLTGNLLDPLLDIELPPVNTDLSGLGLP